MHASQLVEQLHHGHALERQAAAETLSRDEELATQAIPALVRYSGDNDRRVAEFCVATIEELGEPQPDQLPALAALSSDANPDVVYWACTFLGRAGKKASAHALVLASVLASDHPAAVRERAAWAVGQIGSLSGELATQLTLAAESADPALARRASQVRRALA